MWGVEAGSRLFDHQHTDQFADGPGFVLGTTFKDGSNICETDDLDRNSTKSYAESFGTSILEDAFFAFCDGGVRFVFDSVDPSVTNALATRDAIAKEGEVDPLIHESLF